MKTVRRKFTLTLIALFSTFGIAIASGNKEIINKKIKELFPNYIEEKQENPSGFAWSFRQPNTQGVIDLTIERFRSSAEAEKHMKFSRHLPIGQSSQMRGVGDEAYFVDFSTNGSFGKNHPTKEGGWIAFRVKDKVVMVSCRFISFGEVEKLTKAILPFIANIEIESVSDSINLTSSTEEIESINLNFKSMSYRQKLKAISDEVKSVNSAIEQYSLESGKAKGEIIKWSEIRPYLHNETDLYKRGIDLFGNSYPTEFKVGDPLDINSSSKKMLETIKSDKK